MIAGTKPMDVVIVRFTDAERRGLGADASGANLLRDTSVDLDQIDFLRVSTNGYEPTREPRWRRSLRAGGGNSSKIGR